MVTLEQIVRIPEISSIIEEGKRQRAAMKAKMKGLPNGRLCIVQCGKYTQWQYSTTDIDEITKFEKKGLRVKRITETRGVKRYVFYIPKSMKKFATRAIERDYLENLLKGVNEIVDTLEGYLADVEPYIKKEKCMLSHLDRSSLLTAEEAAMREELMEWAYDEYETNQTHPEHKVFETKKGDYVRSKSEQKFANMLYDAGIPYRYEMKQVINGNEHYTDFAMRQPLTGKYYMHEHFGLMDSKSYMYKTIDRLEDYFADGYLIGKDFFVTMETKTRPVTDKEFEQIIKIILADNVPDSVI